MLTAELESLAHAPLQDAGAVSVLRWHALSGYSLELTQFTGGRVTIDAGTGALLAAIAGRAPFEQRLETAVAAVASDARGVEVITRDGESVRARAVVVAVPLNALGAIAFDPPLPEDKQAAIASGQASRGIKLMIHASGRAGRCTNAIRPGSPVRLSRQRGAARRRHPAADRLRARRRRAVTRPTCRPCSASSTRSCPAMRSWMPTAHDWLADEFAHGTWAIHRPGWYEHHHAAMRRPEGRVLLAGSDLANGWAGFIDGAIESGLTAGAAAAAISG